MLPSPILTSKQHPCSIIIILHIKTDADKVRQVAGYSHGDGRARSEDEGCHYRD